MWLGPGKKFIFFRQSFPGAAKASQANLDNQSNQNQENNLNQRFGGQDHLLDPHPEFVYQFNRPVQGTAPL